MDGPGGTALGRASGWAEAWSWFCARLRERSARLIAELEASWQDQRTLCEVPLHCWEHLRLSSFEPLVLEQFLSARAIARERFLADLLSERVRRDPGRRALSASDTYDRGADELLKTLPETISVRARQLNDTLGSVGRWRDLMATILRAERPVRMREALAREVGRQSRERLRLQDRYLFALVSATRDLRCGWELARERIDSAATNRPAPSDASARLRTSIELRSNQAVRGLTELQRWSTGIEPRLARALGTAVLRRPPGPDRKPARAREKHADFWAAWWRAVESEIDLELAVAHCEARLGEIVAAALASIQDEQSAILREVDRALEWLRTDAGSRSEFPPPVSDVAPAASRLAELESSIRAEIGELPESCLVPGNLRVWRPRLNLRAMRPRGVTLRAFLRNGRGGLEGVFEAAEAEHRMLLQEVERAREVVAFAFESSHSAERGEPVLREEAVENAHGLLEFYRRQVSDWPRAAGPRMAAALAATYAETRLVLGRHRAGALAYIADQGFRRAWPVIAHGVLEAISGLLRRARISIQHAAARSLVAIGWKPPARTGQLEVVRRPFLPAEFTARTTAPLPALYRHLFRLEPVCDPHLLVGREREMAAIVEARSLWETGRASSVIIVGERGSGKTSLINCALKQALGNVEVIRTEFRERVVREQELRAGLARELGASGPDELEEFLADRRRVIVLEEVERTFLRQIGYFEAVRALQRLIACTCSQVLWLLSVNAVAFRFLDAAVKLGASFSHRINAATATEADLRSAILQRHRLSGLRLHFAGDQRKRPAAGFRRLVYGEADAEAEFFAALSHESGGVFRTAFDIWLGHVDSVEAGVLSMKALHAPQLAPIIASLQPSDLFTLAAILQHGSLTPGEHATAFQQEVPSSRRQMDELQAREIIEPDPGRAGFRVRPKAVRVVKEALFRWNLL